MALPAPRLLLALLLLAASLDPEGSDQDSPSCTRDALTVPRGQCAVMSCAMSTPLTHVTIHLHAPREASRFIFAEDGPGYFSNNGWHLGVQNGEAWLIIPNAQPTQAGEYTWHLVGTDKRLSYSTSLRVSEPPVTEAASTPPTGWDGLSCNCDTLTVPRGQRAMMCCSMSTHLTHVVIRLRAPGEASELIFAEDGPGHFSNKGWQLEVRGSKARLVIPDAQPAQAGEYTWLLEGTDESVTHTTSLSVSEPPVTEAAPTPPTGTQPPPPASTVSPVPVLLPAVIVPVLVLAVMAVLVVLAWRRRRGSWHQGRIRQLQMSLVQSPGPESGSEQGRLAPGMQP